MLKAIGPGLPVRKCGHDQLRILTRNPATPRREGMRIAEPPPRSGDGFVPVADVVARQLEYLWDPFIPLRKLCVLAGTPGMTKSLVTCSVAAFVSRGLPFPGCAVATSPGDVLILNAEDDPTDTVKPRLMAAGADLDRVHVLRTEGMAIRNLSRRAHRDELGRAMARLKPRLVVIDTINAFIAGVDGNSDIRVREVLWPLSELAARHSASIVAVTHLSKNGRGDPLKRVIGSTGFVGQARSVVLMAPHPADSDRRLFGLQKINVKKPGLAIALRVEEVEVDGLGPQPRIIWDATPQPYSIEEALLAANRAARPTELDRASRWLRRVLANGPVSTGEVLRMGVEVGLAKRTLERAKANLKIQPRPRGHWSLPEPSRATPAQVGEIGELGGDGGKGGQG